jgi:plasmid stabilization system protein ParE
MKIIYNPIFENELLHIVNHIAEDKPNASIKFALELERSILDIPIFPFKYKPSTYFNDKNVRDMTYKKYTVVYEVNLDENTIEILKIFNQNKPSQQ